MITIHILENNKERTSPEKKLINKIILEKKYLNFNKEEIKILASSKNMRLFILTIESFAQALKIEVKSMFHG